MVNATLHFINTLCNDDYGYEAIIDGDTMTATILDITGAFVCVITLVWE